MDDDVSLLDLLVSMIWFVFLPFIAAIVYLMARGDEMRNRQIEDATEEEEALRRRLNVPTGAADQISKLAGLRDSGASTEAEFQTYRPASWRAHDRERPGLRARLMPLPSR